jgi:hypothetical protein
MSEMQIAQINDQKTIRGWKEPTTESAKHAKKTNENSVLSVISVVKD